MASNFKILVTSTRTYAESVSVHTLVIEFEHSVLADIAHSKMVESAKEIYNRTGVIQTFVKLY